MKRRIEAPAHDTRPGHAPPLSKRTENRARICAIIQMSVTPRKMTVLPLDEKRYSRYNRKCQEENDTKPQDNVP